MGKVIELLASIATLIACLGLFGHASFTAEQKTKKIGIRKVLGASTFQILWMLINRYLKLLLIAFIVGIPLSALAINSWMETFVYKAELGNGYYGGVCLLVLIVTIFTVSIESFRTARANPSISIRHE